MNVDACGHVRTWLISSIVLLAAVAPRDLAAACRVCVRWRDVASALLDGVRRVEVAAALGIVEGLGAAAPRIGGATDFRAELGIEGQAVIDARGRWDSDIGFIYQRVTAAEWAAMGSRSSSSSSDAAAAGEALVSGAPATGGAPAVAA